LSFITIQNENISVCFNLEKGISITSILDRVNGNEFLSLPAPLFMFSADEGWPYYSDTSNIFGIQGVVVDSHSLSKDNMSLKIQCHINDKIPVSFSIKASIRPKDAAAVITTTIKNNGNKSLKVRYNNPCIKSIKVPGYPEDCGRMLGMIPQEVGGATALNDGQSIGMDEVIRYISELPRAMNIMQVANIYDRDGKGGIFFASLDDNLKSGILPIQFTVKEAQVSGLWVHSCLEPGISVTAPGLAIGVNHSGNYQDAVDYYMDAHKKTWNFPESPAWLKEAGGIWCPGGAGAGGAYMLWDYYDLNTFISSFDELPGLFDKALSMGTNFFYLVDYWEGDDFISGFAPHYWDKGEYIARADLGGEEALMRGIKGIHDRGGKVILYVEPFIIYMYSDIGKEKGKLWSAYLEDGNPWITYKMNFTMLSTCRSWQDYIVGVSEKLVSKYGADGIFLDSYGYQFNANVTDYNRSRHYTPIQWDKGVYELAGRVRLAITKIKPDAVVLCEGAGSGLEMHTNGGSSADFAWHSGQNQRRIIASPLRYATTDVNYFTNGTTMNHLVQVYASGHSLALNHRWNSQASFIKKLLDIRRQYKDAMIYGRQSQPILKDTNVAAYFYEGEKNTVITVVNVDEASRTIGIKLPFSDNKSSWKDLLSGEVFTPSRGVLGIPAKGSLSGNFGLRVMVKIK